MAGTWQMQIVAVADCGSRMQILPFLMAECLGVLWVESERPAPLKARQPG